MYEGFILFLLIFAPLAHGAVEVWSITVLQAASIIVLIWWLFLMVYRGRVRIIRTPIDMVVLAFLSIAILSMFTSVYPYASRIQLYRIITYTGIFYIVINTLYNRRPRLLMWGLVLFGGGFAIVGLVLLGGRLVGLKTTLSGNHYLSLTFVNHNHFAGYMEMITMLTIGFAMAHRGMKRVVLMGLGIVGSIAIVMSLSRGGIISFAGGLMFFLITMAICRARVKDILMVASLMVFVLIGLYSLGSLETVMERLYTLGTPLETGIARIAVWKDTLKMVFDKPWLGWGLGTFEYVYPRYQGMGAGEYAVKHAHNDYLELTAELGIFGLLLASLGITVLFMSILKKLVKLDKRPYQAIGLGALSACLSLLLHGMTDFNFRIPSNAILFSVCAALAFVYACPEDGGEMPARIDFTSKGRAKGWFYGVIAILGAFSMMATISPYIGSVYLKKAGRYQRFGEYRAFSDAVKMATFFDRGNAEMFARIGDMFVEIAERVGSRRDLAFEEALRYYTRATEACPIRSYYYSKKAFVLQRLGRTREAEETLKEAVSFDPMDYLKHYALARFYLDQGRLNEAFGEYRISIQLRNYEYMLRVLDEIWQVTKDYNDLRQVVPKDAFMRRVFAEYLMKKGREDDALRELAFVFSLEPTIGHAENHIFWARRMKRYRMALDIGERYLRRFGRRVALLRQMAPVYKAVGMQDKAIAAYQDLARKDSGSRSHYILQLANLYRDKRQCYRAIEILQKELHDQSENADFYYLMGKCYRDMNMPEKALMAQEKAVSLRPNSAEFRLMLAMEYLNNGLKYKAYKQLKKCVEIDPGHRGCRVWMNRLRDKKFLLDN
jgi:O-antigen ligase/tetratricopeptide (TPR) repeat protein